MHKTLRTALLILWALLLAGCIVFLAWALTPLGPAPEALAALESNAMVTVQDRGEFIAFTPAGNIPVSGFILYPGGHIDYRSYAPVAQGIATRGYLVAVVKMPFSLAVFGVDRAGDVISAHPGIRYWVIGGHSLGGSAAASYAKAHPEKIGGVAFWASYPPSGDDLSATELKGLSTYGSDDGILDMGQYNATIPLLPPGTIRQVIEGGNHAQFGNYGLQPGDGTATIPTSDQQRQAADLTARLIRAVEGE
jgi:hypothetical protein